MDGDTVHAGERQVAGHEFPVRSVVDAFPCPSRRGPTPHHLVVRSSLLHRVDVASAGALDLELHRDFRIVAPWPHLLPLSGEAIGGFCVRSGVRMRHSRRWQFRIAHPPLVELRVAVLNKRVVGVVRFVGRTDRLMRGFTAVHQLHPRWGFSRWAVSGLRDVLSVYCRHEQNAQGSQREELNSSHAQK